MNTIRELVKCQVGGCVSIQLKDKVKIPVTLVCADTVRPDKAEQVIDWMMKDCSFSDVKLFTNNSSRDYAVKIPTLNGVEDYSKFMIQELWKYVKTSHCLVIQNDGYIINPLEWDDYFLNFDYMASPWLNLQGIGGNGGFSLRSKKLLTLLGTRPFGDNPHPEDDYICRRHGQELNMLGIHFSSRELETKFGFEGRIWNGSDWLSDPRPWNGSFGFHSWLTRLPREVMRPLIFHHSGDAGDVIYSLPTIKAMGGGVLWLSPENHYPFPSQTRVTANESWAHNLCTLLNVQPYLWRAQFTPSYPHSTDYDLNEFRKHYSGFPRVRTQDMFKTLFRLHQDEFGTNYPENQSWLTVDRCDYVEGRDIVINRTARYHNNEFDLHWLVEKYHHRMVFVGSQEEYDQFVLWACPVPKIPYHKTSNLLDVARIIAGAKCFIGNQSCPLAIAHGLGKRVMVEEWRSNPNCHLKRPGAMYGTKGRLDIPKEWLT